MPLPINIHELIHGFIVEWEKSGKPPVKRRIPPDILAQVTKLGLSGDQVQTFTIHDTNHEIKCDQLRPITTDLAYVSGVKHD